MPSIAKPRVAHPSLARNEVGLTIRDYEGTMSTLCAGCGHDSVTAAVHGERRLPPEEPGCQVRCLRSAQARRYLVYKR